MNKLMSSFKDLMTNDRPGFILACVRVAASFLYLISTLFAFCVIITFNDPTPVSAVQFDGTLIFYLILLGLTVLYVYLLLTHDKKWIKNVLMAHAGVATLYFLWGLILFITMIDTATDYSNMTVVPGFGLWFQIVCIALLWFLVFGEKYVVLAIAKIFKIPVLTPVPLEATEIPVEPAPAPIEETPAPAESQNAVLPPPIEEKPAEPPLEPVLDEVPAKVEEQLAPAATEPFVPAQPVEEKVAETPKIEASSPEKTEPPAPEKNE